MVRGWLVRLWPFSSADDGTGDGGHDDDASENTRVWDFVPSWQYDGWGSHTGGLSVDEQERALREIQERAEELEDGEHEER